MARSLSRLLKKAWDRRSPQWRKYALSLTGSYADADDVVVEAAAKTLRAQPDLDSERRLNSYMYAAIRTTAFGLLQQRRRWVQLDEAKAERSLSHASSALRLVLAAEERSEAQELARMLYRELKKLPPERKEAIELLVLREQPLTLRAVAELQGVTVGAVHYRLRKGLDQLTRAMREAANGCDPVPKDH